MSSVNKAMIIGHLGKDPETRYMTNGDAVTSFSIATSETWKDKSGEKQEKTEWHNIVLFKRLAEIAGEYLHKGSLVYIEGKLTTEKWQDKEGKDRYTTKIIANELKMLSGKREGSQQEQNPAEHHSGAREQKNPTYEKASKPAAKTNFDDFLDD